jgi:hypothetical protein
VSTLERVELEVGYAAPAMPDSPVMAASRWPTNAELVADVARLGWLRSSDTVLDPTYGRGRWWAKWRPARLVATDIRLRGARDARPHDARCDFRALPFRSSSFDAVAWDPAYVAAGGRKTTGMVDFHDRYGMDDAPATPAELQAHNNAGLPELVRVLKPGGILLAKTQDYVSSGKLWPGTHYTLTAALELELELVDRLEHIGSPRPQPPRSRADGQPVRQQHSRRNLSTLFVFRKPLERRRRQPSLLEVPA